MDTDPGLGTWQELHDAIAQIQAKGVKMILFDKPIFADMSTDWYKEVLYKYACDRSIRQQVRVGQLQLRHTHSLAGINNRRRAIMDVCCQDIATSQRTNSKRSLALGAAGWLFDEVMQHNGVTYNFSTDHGYKPPGYLFNGDIPLVKQFRAAADKVNPDFLFSGEGPGDWLMPYYVLGYYRIGSGTRHALRYIDPQAPLMAAVRGWDARERSTCCLLIATSSSTSHTTSKAASPPSRSRSNTARRSMRCAANTRRGSGTPNSATPSAPTSPPTAPFATPSFASSDGKRAVMIANLEAGASPSLRNSNCPARARSSQQLPRSPTRNQHRQAHCAFPPAP